jgi:hypothetical protein
MSYKVSGDSKGAEEPNLIAELEMRMKYAFSFDVVLEMW